MNVEQVISALEQIAPPEFAAEWDNVGLLIGSRAGAADKIILTIDLTDAVLNEAIETKTDMVIAYHPPIFHALKTVTDASPASRIVLKAAKNGVAVYSPHTALDAAPEGINDWLAEGIMESSGGDVRALDAASFLPESEQCKIVTFCPADAVDRIRNGMASVGAGRIGAYQLCSFEIKGTGTFLGDESTNPSVGKRCVLERVEEIRLEMVCPKAALALAVVTMKEFHPYEEPPIEIYQLQQRPLRRTGQGRRIVLDQPHPLREIVERVKRRLDVETVQVGATAKAPAKFDTIGVCAGAGGSLLDAAIRQGCRMFITGEMRHHDVLSAQARGCAVILAGHTNTERGFLKVLRRRLAERLDKTHIAISKRDLDPLRTM